MELSRFGGQVTSAVRDSVAKHIPAALDQPVIFLFHDSNSLFNRRSRVRTRSTSNLPWTLSVGPIHATMT